MENDHQPLELPTLSTAQRSSLTSQLYGVDQSSCRPVHAHLHPGTLHFDGRTGSHQLLANYSMA